MRKFLAILGAAFVALGLTALPAQADHAQEWSANGDSSVVDATTVRLEGTNTSVETGNLNLNVDAGATVSFDYELVDGALCEAGAPRVFLIINGINSKSEACDGTGHAETAGTISFTTGNAGLITAAGVVYDSGRPGHVLVSNLTIGGEVVHFMNPEPDPEPTEDPEPTKDPEPEPEPKDDDPEPEPKDERPNDDDDTPAPSSKDGELPDTGGSTAPLLIGAAALGVVGAGAFGLRKMLSH